MNIKGIIENIEHVKLSIYAHPDSQPNSEMADCVDTLSEVIQHLKAHLSDSPTLGVVVTFCRCKGKTGSYIDCSKDKEICKDCDGVKA
jgi:hypothetical protein